MPTQMGNFLMQKPGFYRQFVENPPRGNEIPSRGNKNSLNNFTHSTTQKDGNTSIISNDQ